MNKESAPAPLQVKKHDLLCNKSVRYLVLDFIGEGCFGKVTKCVNLKTSETTAIKIHKDVKDHVTEVKMLKKLRTLDPEKNNLVTFIDSFIYQDMSCLTFTMLDKSLWDFVLQRQAPLSLNEIRPITRQLLVAFKALKSIGIIHTDLKPDNIMLVNHQDEPYRVKLIDFGLAIPASRVKNGTIMQPCAYRAPEVNLGLPISEAIDMWGLGCVLAFLFFGRNLFPGDSTYHMMKTVCNLVGQPKDHVLNAGKTTFQYFCRDKGETNPGWRLNTPKEYKKKNGIKPKISEWIFDSVGNLEDAVEFYSNDNSFVEHEDTMEFLDLLCWLLNPNAGMRITPGQASEHPFVTMLHLAEYIDTSSYGQSAFELMVVSPPNDSDEALSNFEGYMELIDPRAVVSNTNGSRYEVAEHIAGNCDAPTPHKPFQVQTHDILCNNSLRYKILDFIGEGGFGKVAKCVNLKTNEITAIKIHKNVKDHVTEVKMLEQLRTLDPEKNNLVRFIDSFIFQDMSCLAFEMLDKSLWDFVLQGQAPLSLNEIRPITRQLLVAFKALKSIGILHTDLKPDNVMLVNHQDEPYKIKLIDFGLAIPASKVKDGTIMQPCAYRAPEVNLGLPISEAIDMWGLGCVMAFLFLGQNLFPEDSTYHIIKTVCNLVGQPKDHLLNAGKKTCQYFCRDKGKTNPGWRLKTAKEYKKTNGIKPKISEWTFDTVGNLEAVVEQIPNANDIVEHRDRMAFLGLVQRLLDTDAETRVTPGQALKHCFVTMSHLVEDMNTNAYAQAAFKLMVVSPPYDSDDRHDPLSDFEWQMESTDSRAKVSNTNSSRYEGAEPIADNCDPPTPNKPFQVQTYDVLCNNSLRYKILDFIGEGGFGKVAKCVNLKTNEITAIKIHKDVKDHVREVKMLEQLRTLDPEKNYLVRFIDNFIYQDMSCLAFEMLDKSLKDFLVQRHAPLTTFEIRPITHQLLVAFKALKSIGIIHTDLKPDNVMLVNHQDEPYRVKLIDFGLAIPASKVKNGMTFQAIAYRAPEVNLGLPISEAIDMWGLGCVMADLYFRRNLFAGESTYHMMKTVFHLLGQPEDHLLNAGKNTYQYFNREQGSINPGWRLKTPEEYMKATGIQPQISKWFFDSVGNLDEAIERYSEEGDDVMHGDRMAFLHLLKRLLELDAEKRITPGQALNHCYVTMIHLEEDMDTSSYEQAAFQLTPLDYSDEW